MPPKKSSSRKATTKLAVSEADATVLSNGEKDLSELAIDEKNLRNGSAEPDVVKETSKSKVTKKGVGRSKNVLSELVTEALPNKKPVARGRGKNKSIENEVIENGTTETQTEIQVEAAETGSTEEKKEEVEAITKPKGRGGKKAVSNKSFSKIKIDVKATEVVTENTQQDEETSLVEVKKTPEKKTKIAGGRKNKREAKTKSKDKVEKEQENLEELVKEKDTKKSTKNSKKSEETLAEIEPPKKKGRASKTEKSLEINDVQVTMIEVKGEEKKPTKRSRVASKTAATTEEMPKTNGESEEIIPNKRSRKAASIEKEIKVVKSKKGRGKKAEQNGEKVTEKIVASEQGKKDEAEITNGQVEQDKNEDINEISLSNKQVEEPAVVTKIKGGRKRAAPSTNNKKSTKTTAEVDVQLENGVDNCIELGDDEADGSKTSKSKNKKNDSAPLNATATKYIKADFELPPPADGQTVEEPRFNLKISSWNVAGLRSWLKKEGLKFLEYEQPDIFCMQETKCTTDQLPEEVTPIPGYHPYWLCMPGGYAGVAIYSKIMPINVEYGIGNKDFDDCGRIITAEYEKFFLINVYVPNSGRKLVNLETRMKWEKLFQEFVKKLDAHKPVVICGDMNVSHQEHDLANPKTNTRNAGFTKEERDKMSELLALGYIDTFRHLYPDRKGAYTFWTYMGNARSRNVGWRLDYFIVSERFIKRIVDNCIRSQCLGSDHCPITLFLKL